MAGHLQRALFMAALAALPHAHSQEANDMNESNHELSVAQRLIDVHFEIWNDPNPVNWASKFPKVYARDFFVADYSGMATGYDAVSKLIQKVQGEHAGFSFHPDPVSWNHGVGRVTWGYGPSTNPNLVRGEDIFTIKDGKLASARVFLDKK